MNTTALSNAEKFGWETKSGFQIFSGHESFACRYGWLPKLYEAVTDDPSLFSSDDRAILRLGIGRNMVKSLRFWGEAFRITRTRGHEVRTTEFARKLLDPTSGLDPYLESQGALWRLHWILTVHGSLGAWILAFLETHNREITRERFVSALRSRAIESRGNITLGTANNHTDILLRTYAAGHRPVRSLDEALESPFQELGLIQIDLPGGIPTLRLLRGSKPSLDVEALAFALHDFWLGTAADSTTLSMRSLMLSYAAPGAVLLLNELGLYEKLDELCTRAGSLTLRSDGAGGFNLVGSVDSLHELSDLAWP